MATFISNGEPITSPSPQYGLPIISNNGVLKVSMQLLVNGNLANGTTNWDTAIGVVYTDTADYAQFYNSASNLVYCRCLPPTRIAGHKYAYLLKGYASLQSGNSSWGSRNAGSFGQMPTTDTLMAGVDEFPTGGGGNPWISLPVGVTVYINKSAGFRMYDLTALGLDTTITTAEDVIAYFGETYEEPKQIKVSGTTETVEVHGKNLFNPSITPSSFGAYLGVSLSNYLGNYICKLTRKTNEDVPSGNFGVVYKHKNSNPSARWFINQGVESSTYIPNGLLIGSIIQTDLEWISLACYPSDAITWNAFLNAYNIQIEQGSTATDYEPYFNGGSATAEMLLKVGDYKDVQSVLDGGVTRNVGVKVFDGTEDWSYYSVQQGNLFRITIDDSVSNDKDLLGVFCNSYKVSSVGDRTNGTLSGRTKYCDFINNNYTNLTDWTAYLAQQYNAGTPVIIVYALAEPTTETVTGQPLSIQAGTNIITVEGSIDNLPIEVSYKAGVAVTITEVQNVQLSNSVEVTING